MNDTLVCYHKDCLDGFGAAYAAWCDLKETAKYVPVNYPNTRAEGGSSAPVGEEFARLIDGAEYVYFVDFCPEDRYLRTLSKTKDVVVIDHHPRALEVADNYCCNPIFSVSEGRSGAALTWRWFHTDPMPAFLEAIEDRDLWEFKLPYSKEICAALQTYPKTFTVWDTFRSPDTLGKLTEEGLVLLRYQHRLIEQSADKARLTWFQGYLVPTVTTTVLHSEIGNELCRRFPNARFAVVMTESSNGMSYSLRSIGDFDVSKVAAQIGGGGHKNAAGVFIPDKVEDY